MGLTFLCKTLVGKSVELTFEDHETVSELRQRIIEIFGFNVFTLVQKGGKKLEHDCLLLREVAKQGSTEIFVIQRILCTADFWSIEPSTTTKIHPYVLEELEHTLKYESLKWVHVSDVLFCGWKQPSDAFLLPNRCLVFCIASTHRGKISGIVPCFPRVKTSNPLVFNGTLYTAMFDEYEHISSKYADLFEGLLAIQRMTQYPLLPLQWICCKCSDGDPSANIPSHVKNESKDYDFVSEKLVSQLKVENINTHIDAVLFNVMKDYEWELEHFFNYPEQTQKFFIFMMFLRKTKSLFSCLPMEIFKKLMTMCIQ